MTQAPPEPYAILLRQWSRVRIRHHPQMSWCVAGSLCYTVNLRVQRKIKNWGPKRKKVSSLKNAVFGVLENVLRINKIIYFCFIEIVRKCIKTWIFFFIVCSSLMHHRGSAIFIDVPFKCHFWAFWDLGEVKCWCLLVWKQKSNQRRYTNSQSGQMELRFYSSSMNGMIGFRLGDKVRLPPTNIKVVSLLFLELYSIDQ